MAKRVPFTFEVRPYPRGGWEIEVRAYESVSAYPFHPEVHTHRFIDPEGLVAEVSRLTTRMALGRDYDLKP